MRSIKIDPNESKDRYVIPIKRGGTGADNQEEAIANLGGISLRKINQPGGHAGLDGNNLIDEDLIPTGVNFGIPLNIKGPLSIPINVETRYEITNFDSFTNYDLVLDGCSGYRDDQHLYITALKRGSVSMRVNNSDFTINVLGNNPKNIGIAGGEPGGTVEPMESNTNLGTSLDFSDEGLFVVGSPFYSTATAAEVGRVDILNPERTFQKTINGTSGSLNFTIDLAQNKSVLVSSDAPGFTNTTVSSDGNVVIPSGSSSVRFAGTGGDGASAWIPEVIGTPVAGVNGVPIADHYTIEVKSVLNNGTNTTTKVFISEPIDRTFIQKSGIAYIAEESYTASSDVNTSNGLMNIKLSQTQISIEIQNGPTTFDTLEIVLKDSNGMIIPTTGNLGYVSTNTTTRMSTFIFPGVQKVYEGRVAGHWTHTRGESTYVGGHGRNISWRGGFADPQGLGLPKIGDLFFDPTLKVAVEFRYNTHPLFAGACVLTSPTIAGAGLLEPLSIGNGRDFIERELQWSLRQSVLNTTIRSGNGDIQITFQDGKIRFVPSFNGVIWQNPPISAHFIVETMMNGSPIRREFPMTQILGGEGNVFEVTGFTYAKNGTLPSEFEAAEASTFTLNTSGASRFGELLAVAQHTNILAVGVKRSSISERGLIAVYENYLSDEPSKSELLLSDTNTFNQTLESLTIAEDGSYLLGGYPAYANGVVGVFKKAAVSYTEQLIVHGPSVFNGRFGTSIDIDAEGKMFVASAPGANQVYGYDIDLIITEKFVIDAPTGYTEFGRCVRLSDDNKLLFVSALSSDGRGAVLIYDINADGTTTHVQTLVPPNDLPVGIDFGKTFDIDANGDMIAVGAPGNSTLIGRVFLYFNGTENWEHYKTLGENEATIGGMFGASIVVRQNSKTILVGGPKEVRNPGTSGFVISYNGAFKYLE